MVSSKGCPLRVAYEVAADNVNSNTEHSQRDIALGMIGLSVSILETLSEQLDCDGPRLDDHGHMICPLENAVNIARNFSINKVNPAAIAADLTEFDTSHQPSTSSNSGAGQYL